MVQQVNRGNASEEEYQRALKLRDEYGPLITLLGTSKHAFTRGTRWHYVVQMREALLERVAIDNAHRIYRMCDGDDDKLALFPMGPHYEIYQGANEDLMQMPYVEDYCQRAVELLEGVVACEDYGYPYDVLKDLPVGVGMREHMADRPNAYRKVHAEAVDLVRDFVCDDKARKAWRSRVQSSKEQWGDVYAKVFGNEV